MRLAEELLLLLREDDGTLYRVPEWFARYALGGAVLMDLALEHRIDTDAQKLFVTDSTPVGDELLDPMLSEIEHSQKTHDALYWLDHATKHADEIRDKALSRLINNGILELKDNRYLWIFGTRNYLLKEKEVEDELIQRIRLVLITDTIPDPKDTLIVTLAEGCGLLTYFLSGEELASMKPRIELLRNIELIGRVFLEMLNVAVQPAAGKLDEGSS
ncbi:MAG: GPP34 family phosphoprotein [Rhodobacteraceae bacterium]|nr:GPP34 family phosphoprotein [Paracoccaceae bacterium]